ncbi:hypothetical protein [Pseudomonas sp. KK4]|uniref:hypothetical protein n=1 Tax=Pseudomonas sp. KK4 TaxID=1855729 RepID=UPI0011158BEE|nr:hypothetical protein [Pseudomonas sp. KK4]
MTIKRIRTCAICNNEFITSQIKAKHCQPCRPKARQKNQQNKRQTIAQKRVLKLSQSDEWLWIARECKRAGTVEILHGVDIPALLTVYRSRFKTHGYDKETNKTNYHLCHISPAVGKETVGLLHHQNLFIGSAFHNQTHGNKSYLDRGLCIPKSKLKARWKVTSTTSDRVVLDKVTEFLGQVLIDYAKENPVTKSQRFCVAKWIFQNDPNNTLPLSKLEQMSMSDLRAIKAKAAEKEAYIIDYATKRSFIVLLEECERLSEQLPAGEHQSDIAFMVPVLQVAVAWLSRQPDQQGLSSILENPYGVTWNPLQLREGMDASMLRDFIGFRTFHTLQGQPLDRRMIRNTLSKYLMVTSLSPDYSESDANSAIQRHYADEYSRFVKQVPVIKNAIITLGLPDNLMLADEIAKAEVAAYEESMFACFQPNQCTDLLDYSTTHYEVEHDYTPNPNLVTYQEPTFCPF